jgi:hypothetical protein
MCDNHCLVQTENNKILSYNKILSLKENNNEQNGQLFIFEIILIDNNNKLLTIRKIKKEPQGIILSLLDNILYDKIYNIKICIYNRNNLNNEINIKINIDHKMTYTTFINNNIYLEFKKNNNFMECNYNINI